MLGLGVVLCALGLPASHHKSHKSHKHDSDAAAPPGHELPASAKTHAVSKHKAVKHTAKSHANSHHAPAHAKHHAKIREDHANAAAKAAAKGHLPPVPKDFVALKDNSQISWEVLQLGPDDCMPPTCEPGMRCAEFNQVETDALVYSNLANKGPNNNCQETTVPGKLECESCPYDEAAEPGVWAESGHCSVTGIRVNRAGKNKDGVEFDYIIDLQEGSEYHVNNPIRNELFIAANGEAMLQINLKTSKEIGSEVRAPCRSALVGSQPAPSPRPARAPRRLTALPLPPPRAATPVAPPSPLLPPPPLRAGVLRDDVLQARHHGADGARRLHRLVHRPRHQ
jgi:hypothetical protein